MWSSTVLIYFYDDDDNDAAFYKFLHYRLSVWKKFYNFRNINTD